MTQATTAPDTLPTHADAPSTPSAAALAPTIEAILFPTDRPVSAARLAEVLGFTPPEEAPQDAAPQDPAPPSTDAPAPDAAAPFPEPKPRRRKSKPTGPSAGSVIKDAVALLNAAYEQSNRSFRIETVAGGYRVMMLPQFAPAIAALQGSR